MHIRQQIELLIPETPREIVKGFLRKAFYPDYGFTLNRIITAVYSVKNAKHALWSADSQKPYGTLMNSFSFPHFLLARAMIRTCDVRSWCDLGTGSATLPFQAARLGVTDVFAIDGSDAALRSGKVQLPLSNYCVADVCVPLEVIAESGAPARFDVVSALELVEHIPDSKLAGLFDNIRRLQPKYVIFAVGLQPEAPYHVNLKSMLEWLRIISNMLTGWVYDDKLSTKIFRSTRCHTRFINDYPSNHLPSHRNLIIFTR
jgi:2-polyprenyl-3-methyl-5-hydroxy-6-metoxy-1,4-benzoquinol methylase